MLPAVFCLLSCICALSLSSTGVRDIREKMHTPESPLASHPPAHPSPDNPFPGIIYENPFASRPPAHQRPENQNGDDLLHHLADNRHRPSNRSLHSLRFNRNGKKIVWDYAILVDAGSKGSRCHIYKWTRRHSTGSLPPFTKPVSYGNSSFAITPGISSFQDKPEDAASTILPLVEWAKEQLQHAKSRWGEIPFYLKATAGMRLVHRLQVRDRIMNTIRDSLSDPTLSPFKFQRTYARVISGEEEGVYGWLAVNYVFNTLLDTPIGDSYGALDLGGGSTQITFRPQHDVLAGYFPVRLLQEKIRLYTHSFLYYGHDEIVQRTFGVLLKRKNYTFPTWDDRMRTRAADLPQPPPIKHPCFPIGFEGDFPFMDKINLEDHTANANYADQHKTSIQEPDEIVSPVNVRVKGTSKPHKCRQLLFSLLLKDQECLTNTCSFAGVYQPRMENTAFVAFSGFYKAVVRYLGLPYDVSLMTLGLAADDICRKEMHELERKYGRDEDGHGEKLDNLIMMCIQSQYTFSLLHHGYGMSRMGTRILFMDTKGDFPIDWTIGSIIYEANALPWEIDDCPNAPSYPTLLRLVEAPPRHDIDLALMETEQLARQENEEEHEQPLVARAQSAYSTDSNDNGSSTASWRKGDDQLQNSRTADWVTPPALLGSGTGQGLWQLTHWLALLIGLALGHLTAHVKLANSQLWSAFYIWLPGRGRAGGNELRQQAVLSEEGAGVQAGCNQPLLRESGLLSRQAGGYGSL